MKKNNLPKWSDRTLLEKICTCLIVLFGVLAIIFIILESTNANIPNRLDTLFISLELICIGLVYYKHNKPLSIFLLVICGISLILTLIKLFI